MSRWQPESRFSMLFSELQELVGMRRRRHVPKDPESELPDAEISEKERHEALEREADRREHEDK